MRVEKCATDLETVSVICKLCSSCVELSSILLDQFRYQTSPASLVARANAGAVVTVEILMERDQIAPVRVILEFFSAAENRSSLICILQEDAHQPL